MFVGRQTSILLEQHGSSKHAAAARRYRALLVLLCL